MIKRYLTYKVKDRFELIKNVTSLRSKDITISSMFERLYECYSLTLRDKGLLGVWRERRLVLEEIRSLNFGMFNKDTKILQESDLNEYLRHLKVLKDVLTDIKYTVESLILVKVVFTFIARTAFIPILVLSIFILFRKVYVVFSLLFTSTFATIYLTNHYDYISKANDYYLAIICYLRGISIKWHNWLFNDDLISKVEVDRAINIIIGENQPSATNLIERFTKYCSNCYDYLTSNPTVVDINWAVAGYVSLTLLTIGTLYLTYTGTIEASSIKKVGSYIYTLGASILSYFGLSDDSPPGDGPDNNPTSNDHRELFKGKGRADSTEFNPIIIDRSIENIVPKAISKQGDLPPDSATMKWSLPDSLREPSVPLNASFKPSSTPLIELTPNPPSPTGSDASDKTIKALNIGVGSKNILTELNTPNTEFFNKQQNNPPSSLLLESVLVLPTMGSSYPDPNLGIWEPIYIKYAKGVGTPESYEHFTALNERFPNLTPLELEDVCNKIKAGDNSIFNDHPMPYQLQPLIVRRG